MTKSTHFVALSLLAGAALAASATGCELVASVDRSKISNGAGGAGGGSSSPISSSSSGFSSSGFSSSGSSSSESLSSGSSSSGSSSSGSSSSSSSSAVNCATTGEATCTTPSDCVQPTTNCKTAQCVSNCCTTSNALIPTGCSDNGGQVCDGNGNCVQCNQASDCADPTTTCKIKACDTAAHSCGATNAPKGTACNDNGGLVCDGNGNCVSTHCADGIQDADETDVDCGGSCGATCKDTSPQQQCKVASDCVSGVCGDSGSASSSSSSSSSSTSSSGAPLFCQPPTCTDGVQNGNETDKDCGGTEFNGNPACPKCTDSLHCKGNSDCVNNDCFGSGATAVCVSCADNKLDGNETDKDCGGIDCVAQGKTCATGQRCGSATDCKSGYCDNGVCALRPDGQSCTSDAQCLNNSCIGPAGSQICCNTACTGTCMACTIALTNVATGTCAPIAKGTAAPSGQCPTTTTCGNDGKCDGNGGCELADATVSCGDATCSNGQFTVANSGACSGTGACNTGSPQACPGGLKCADSTTCLSTCTTDNDCQSSDAYCSGGSCVAKGGAGSECSGNNQCSSAKCGALGFGHCCSSTSTCSSSVAACGATDCDTSGACLYPGNTVAPASLQTPGDCQKVVCNGAGGTTSTDDAMDSPGLSGSACLVAPACCGSPLTPCYTTAPTGTPCTAAYDPSAHVCGDTANDWIAGTCVECNNDVDCLAVSDAGTLVCDTRTGTCQ